MVVRGNLRRDARLCAAKREEMYFLAITRRRVERFTQAEFDARLGDEADCARALYAGGTFRAIHSRGDVPGAVIAVEAEDLGAARAAVATLPLAIHEMMDVELIPMLPYRGFV